MKSLFKFSSVLVLLSSYVIIEQDASQEEVMTEWQTNMTPGSEHKILSSLVGDWDGDITVWLNHTKPDNMKGTTKYESIMDGRYIVGKYSGFMMGMPFSGMDISGFDNALKVFQNIWIDNMGTGIMHLEGTYDKNTNSIVYKGNMVIPNGSKVDVRQVLTLIDKDHSTFEMFVDMGTGETKSMEIKYTRKS